MSVRKQVVTAGVLGLIVAFGLIAGSAYFLPLSSTQTSVSSFPVQIGSSATSQSSNSPQSSNSQTTSSGQSSNSASAQSTSQSQSAQPAGTGTVDVLLTDPPTLPVGVTAVYVTYSNVAVHVSGAGNQTGWTNSNTKGTLNLVKLVNISTTIASVKVTSGVYNALRFNISSASVTYNGKNYTAFVPRALLSVPIPGGIQVNASKSSAAIIDMYPTVVNIGSNSTPEFIINTAASGYLVPPQSVTGDMDHNGNKIDLVTAVWWHLINERYTANVTITGATLKAGSFSVTVKNTGSTPLNLSAIFIAPLGDECPTAAVSTTTTSHTSSTQRDHNNGKVSLPTCLVGSANYLVLNNGTIVPIDASLHVVMPMGAALHMSPKEIDASIAQSWGLFGQTGYQLAAGKSVTLTYTGSITFGLGIHFMNMVLPGVISGDQYEITVVGQQALAATIVVAS